MTRPDPRAGNPFYYDLDESPLPDIPFYLDQIPAGASALELGCGTGRLLAHLAPRASRAAGVDYSADMIRRCRERVPGADLRVGDITDLDLGETFDWIVAGYRVIQALETDAEIAGLFRTIRRHLAPGGQGVLNAFNPRYSPEEMRRSWAKPGELPRWERDLPDGTRVVHTERYHRMDPDRLVLYPELVYRRYDGDRLVHEHVQPVKMRCHYPDEFAGLIESAGFRITGRWGGYAGEPYGGGSELVVRFELSN